MVTGEFIKQLLADKINNGKENKITIDDLNFQFVYKDNDGTLGNPMLPHHIYSKVSEETIKEIGTLYLKDQ
jgi:hypothetical protein